MRVKEMVTFCSRKCGLLYEATYYARKTRNFVNDQTFWVFWVCHVENRHGQIFLMVTSPFKTYKHFLSLIAWCFLAVPKVPVSGNLSVFTYLLGNFVFASPDSKLSLEIPPSGHEYFLSTFWQGWIRYANSQSLLIGSCAVSTINNMKARQGGQKGIFFWGGVGRMAAVSWWSWSAGRQKVFMLMRKGIE